MEQGIYNNWKVYFHFLICELFANILSSNFLVIVHRTVEVYLTFFSTDTNSKQNAFVSL